MSAGRKHITDSDGLFPAERQRTRSKADTKSVTSSSEQVAFPQPSILSELDIQRGTAAAGGLLGMLIGTTILPNLWLAGMTFGFYFGYEM